MPSQTHWPIGRRLVTHARPHIDDIMALWLLQQFHPDFAQASVEFIAKGSQQAAVPTDAVAIGIGGGQFDEHKGDIGESATSLVWKWLQAQPAVKLSDIDQFALDRLVQWVHREDLGQLKTQSWWEWSITVPVEYSFDLFHGDNQHVYAFGSQILAAAFGYYQSLVQLDLDWAKRIEFPTRWGKAIALESPASGLSQKAWEHGAVLVVQANPVEGQRQFRAKQDSKVDFSELYERVHALEPKASWFLHHEKRMLLCGSRTAVTFVPSQLTLRELIGLIQQPDER